MSVMTFRRVLDIRITSLCFTRSGRGRSERAGTGSDRRCTRAGHCGYGCQALIHERGIADSLPFETELADPTADDEEMIDVGTAEALNSVTEGRTPVVRVAEVVGIADEATPLVVDSTVVLDLTCQWRARMVIELTTASLPPRIPPNNPSSSSASPAGVVVVVAPLCLLAMSIINSLSYRLAISLCRAG